jgi:hypothetical protein
MSGVASSVPCRLTFAQALFNDASCPALGSAAMFIFLIRSNPKLRINQ